MTQKEFHRLVQEALEALPPVYQEKLDQVVIVVEDRPSLQALREAGIPKDQTLFGQFIGTSLTQKENISSHPLPDRVILYQKPLEESFPRRKELIREIKITLWHELGHFFGMGEADLRRLGYE